MDDAVRSDLAGRLRLVDSLVAAVTDSLSTLQRLLAEAQLEVAQARHEEEHASRDGEILALRREVEQLRAGVGSRAVIERAKGMLMQAHALSEEQSFELLTELSNRQHRKLRDVAADLVTGAAGPPDGEPAVAPAAAPRPHLVGAPDPAPARTAARA